TLERAWTTGDLDARLRLMHILERDGHLADYDAELGAVLDVVQADEKIVHPTASKLALHGLAAAVRELAENADLGWSLLIAEHHFRSPTASPEGTIALLSRE